MGVLLEVFRRYHYRRGAEKKNHFPRNSCNAPTRTETNKSPAKQNQRGQRINQATGRKTHLTGGNMSEGPEARLAPRRGGKCYVLIHRRHGKIGKEFYSQFVGEVAIDNAESLKKISPETARKLHRELRDLKLPGSATQEDIRIADGNT